MFQCDDTRGCIVQFWPPDDKHTCSKHVDAWNKLILKFSASSRLILINKLRCYLWRQSCTGRKGEFLLKNRMCLNRTPINISYTKFCPRLIPLLSLRLCDSLETVHTPVLFMFYYWCKIIFYTFLVRYAYSYTLFHKCELSLFCVANVSRQHSCFHFQNTLTFYTLPVT